jgi:hypothetical protein
MRMNQQPDSRPVRRVRTLLSAAFAAFLVLGGQVAANAQPLPDHPNSVTSCSFMPATATIEALGFFTFTQRFDGTANGSGGVRVYAEYSGYWGDFAFFEWFEANKDFEGTLANDDPPTGAAIATVIIYSVTLDGGVENKGVEKCRLELTFLPVGGLSADDDELSADDDELSADDDELSADDDEATPSPIALSCSPDRVVAGGAVTCLVTGGDPNVEILWRASYNPAFAGQGVRLDAEGNGSFSFVAPAAALGLPLTVELVEWDRTAVVTVGGPVPASVPAGEGQGGLPLGVTLGGLLALAGALRLRLHRVGSVA